MAKREKKPARARKPRAVKERIEFSHDQRELISRLAAAGSSQDEIAAMLRLAGIACSRSTLQRRLRDPDMREIYEDGVNIGRAKLRSRMMQQSMMMNGAGVHQAQFLAVNWLGMKRQPAEADDGADKMQQFDEAASARARVTAKLETLSKRLLGRGLGSGSQATAALPAPTQTERN